MEQEKKNVPQRPSKKDRANKLLVLLDKWQQEGLTAEESIEKLTLQQYDFLIDYGVNLDNLILTTQQQNAITAITKTARPCGMVYKKQYPQSKQELYTNLENFIREQGATIQKREKENYRDLDFEIDSIAYKIVLSNPRVKK